MDILPNIPIKFDLNYDDIPLEWNLISLSMGYPIDKTPEFIIDLINAELNKIKNSCKIEACINVFAKDLFLWNKDKVYINCIEFNTGSIIASQLKKSEGIIVFTATIGAYFETESKKYFDSGDSVSGFIVDTIGSELVEKAGDWIEIKLLDYFLPSGIKITHRYSPGYCNWNVEEQFKLFSLLPKDFTAISLTESALMRPIKSISGVIGYGNNIANSNYPCNICGMSYCYKRK